MAWLHHTAIGMILPSGDAVHFHCQNRQNLQIRQRVKEEAAKYCQVVVMKGIDGVHATYPEADRSSTQD